MVNDFIRSVGENMKHEASKHRNKQSSFLKKYMVPIVGVLLIVLLMAAIKYFNS